MPAADFPTLYRFEDYIEAACVTILTNASLVAYRQQGNASLPTPRVDVQLSVGPAIEHYVPNTAGEQFVNTWQGALRFGIITKRETGGTTHRTYRSTVRSEMNRISRFTVTMLPYHTISKLIEAGTQPSAVQDEHHDVSIITYNIWWQILPAAFPTT